MEAVVSGPYIWAFTSRVSSAFRPSRAYRCFLPPPRGPGMLKRCDKTSCQASMIACVDFTDLGPRLNRRRTMPPSFSGPKFGRDLSRCPPLSALVGLRTAILSRSGYRAAARLGGRLTNAPGASPCPPLDNASGRPSVERRSSTVTKGRKRYVASSVKEASQASERRGCVTPPSRGGQPPRVYSPFYPGWCRSCLHQSLARRPAGGLAS